ncbi:Beclin 1-associated autophagy-related key regulator, partial [Geodia barretti]
MRGLCVMIEYEELQQVASSNQRREDRLARVRGKDFSKRLQDMERECGERKREAEEKKQRLQDARRESVVTLQSSVFPIQVEPLSQDDAGEDDYQLSAVIDCETAMDVDDGWVLSGVHRSPTPHASIISASLPLNGDYSPYIEASEERRKKLKTASETGAPLPPVTATGLHPLLQPYLAVPAGLQFTAQFVEIAADILDTPLSHPLHRPLCILEYGNQNKKRRSFVESRAKLDDNILYLCFSQNVPLSALSPGHTLSNILALVTHSELGRQGAFSCQPDLAMYRGDSGALAGDPENEPPSLCTAAADLPPEDSDEGEEEE